MSEKVRTAIEKANVRFVEEVRKGNASGLSLLYTEDAVLLPPNSDKVLGRKATEKFWGGAISQLGLKDAVLKTEELTGSGDTYTEVGSYTLKLQAKGQKPVEDKGKYVVIWKQTPDGWKLHRDIWNSNLPPSK